MDEEYTGADESEDTSLSRPWLAAIKESEKAFQVYQDKCDNIDKIYASFKDMAEASGDREFKIFWANLEVLRPSIYQRPPQPVVMPRHSDTGEVPRKAAELLERVMEFDVEFDDVHEVLLQVRDDLALNSRGVSWVLDTGHVIHVDRHDFAHEPARKWQECGWVARRAYLSRDEGVKRFGEVFMRAKLEEQGKEREDDYQTTEKKAQVWEIWSKTEQKVVWVTEGVDEVLEESDPLFDVKGFFPCPKPAYGTLERGTLLPVPDFVYYRDQVDEINELTARISSLSESLRMKGFYAAGVSEIGDAIETAMKRTDDAAILIPVSNLSALGGVGLKDSIIWLPVREVATVIEQLVMLRRQLIDDVYQITGLSDIMRGVTDAQETLGAQNLKAQFGSIRVREKQNEIIRVGVEILRIKAEIYAETMPVTELVAMAGMQIPTQEQIQQQALQIQMQMRQAQGPQQVQAMQGQLMQLQSVVTVEAIGELLTNQRTRPFILEIETDSTIAPNEEAEKQNRTEMLQAMGNFMGQALPLLEARPEAAPFMGELMKFGAGAFRSNRDLGGAIEEFTKQMSQAGQQQADPAAEAEAQKMQIEAQTAQAELQIKQQEVQIKGQELMVRQQEMQNKAQESAANAETRRYDAQARMAMKQYELSLKAKELGLKVSDQRLKQQQAELQALLDVEEMEMEREQQRPVALGDTN